MASAASPARTGALHPVTIHGAEHVGPPSAGRFVRCDSHGRDRRREAQRIYAGTAARLVASIVICDRADYQALGPFDMHQAFKCFRSQLGFVIDIRVLLLVGMARINRTSRSVPNTFERRSTDFPIR